MQQVTRHYPMQGTKRYETTSFLCVKSFRLTATAFSADKTSQLYLFSKGSTILGFVGKVTTAFESTASGKIQIGFTGQSMLSAATAVTSVDAVGDILGPSTTGAGTAQPYVLVADDTFDAIDTTGAFTAGEMDVHVIYVPPPDGVLDSTFKAYALT